MTTQDQIIISTKEDAEVMRWLQLAASKDESRPVLQAIRKEGENCITADGWRLHIAPAPSAMADFTEDSNTIVNSGKPIAKSAGRIYSAQNEDGQYPDYDQVIPKNEPRAVVTLNKKFLIDICNMPDDDSSNNPAIVLEIRAPHEPIIVSNSQYKAILMPMSIDNALSDQVNKKYNAMVRTLDNLKEDYPDIYITCSS